MASAEALQAQIAEVNRASEVETRKKDVLQQDIVEANHRAELRRQLRKANAELSQRRAANSQLIRDREDIDELEEDSDGDVVKDAVDRLWVRRSTAGKATVTTGVRKGEYTWKMEGMSWLENALAGKGDSRLVGETFAVGNICFDLVYAPGARTTLYYGAGFYHVGSLAMRFLGDESIAFRYKIFIKKAGGDFVQWGSEANECGLGEESDLMAFGPDVQKLARGSGAEPVRPIGIFGLKHDDLVKSEWVEADTLTVKVEVEVMETCSLESDEVAGADVVVQPTTMSTSFLAMLDDARHTDITFRIDGRQISAHSFVLMARSEVFDRELNCAMQESLSKVIEIKDADFATFDVFLRFLYSDDLEYVKTLVAKVLESETSGGDGTPSTSNPRTEILQSILATSHKYQVQRLQQWCEQQLCAYIRKDQVCSILCQAHLYDARQLEMVCLNFIKSHMGLVIGTRGFGSLSAEWPDVLLKINIFCAGVSDQGASEALAAHEESRKKRTVQQSDEAAAASAKRTRSE